MKQSTLVFWLVMVGLALPVSAENRESPSSEETRLQALTTQYTQRYRDGAFTEAIPIATQALGLAESLFGPDHERVAQVLNDLGRLYDSQHDLEQAARMHERALAIRERAVDVESPAVIQSLNNLAKVDMALGRYAQAQGLYKRSLAIAERHMPSDSPSLLSVLEPYAAALRGAEQLEAATVVEARIQQIRVGKSGDAKPK